MHSVEHRLNRDDSLYISTKKLFYITIFIGVLTPWIIEGLSNPQNILEPVIWIKGVIISAVIFGVGVLGMNISLANIYNYSRLSERTIEEREDFYELKRFTDGLINSSGVLINIINENCVVEFGNNESAEQFGLLEGRKCHEVFFDSRGPCENCMMQEAIRTGIVTSEISTWKNNISYESFFIPFENSDRSVSVIGVHRDVTEQIKIEKEMEAVKGLNEKIIKNAPYGIVTLTQSGALTSCNPKFLEIVGAPVESDFNRSQFFRELGLTEKIENAFSGTPFSEFGVKWEDTNREMVFNIRCTPLKEAAGTEATLLVILEDTTERYWMRRKINDSYMKLQSAYGELKIMSRARDEILTNVTHEIRTPITICSSALDLAAEEEGDEQQMLIRMAKDAVIRLSGKVSDLITVSEIQKGRFRLNRRETDMRAIINKALFDNIAQIREKQIEIDLTIDDNLPMIEVDEESMERVVSNIVDNAVKFNGPGGRISISALRSNGSIKVCVRDTGVGIPRGHFKDIFKRFFQADSSSTRCYGGTGMGLAVAKEVIESHGGRINVKSKVEAGSEFSFTLPLKPAGDVQI
ncbi:MAG TPA: PAS domain-containing protein [Euryarchaeota archaeon]|nr:PAS domain-containing protein [Euryarchaeota archaeon]